MNIIVVFSCGYIHELTFLLKWLPDLKHVTSEKDAKKSVTHWPKSKASNFKPITDYRDDGYSKFYYISIVLFFLLIVD